MFFSIRTKIFILIIAANTFLVAAFLVVNALTFDRSFLEYVRLQEARRLSPLIENIAKTYEQQGSWQWLKKDSNLWHRVIRDSLATNGNRQPPPQPNTNNALPPRQNNTGRPPRYERIPYLDRLRIQNAQHRIILGDKSNKNKLLWLPIHSIVSREIIGYLGFEANDRLDAKFDKILTQKLRNQLLGFSLLVLMISAGFAIPFSGWLVKPIQRLTKAMREMTNGDFSVSVFETRKDELGQLALDFNRLATVLKNNAAARDQWVSDIAHELRTPVAVLQGDIEAAQDGIRTVDAKWLNAMQNNVGRLGQLVNDLHLLSQSDAGTLNYRFESVELGVLIEEIIEQNKHSLADKFIQADMTLPEDRLYVRGDSLRLVQLLNNLMQNTLRYTDGIQSRNGHLVVELSAAGSEVLLVWLDSSPGVSALDLPKLFDRLYRVDESRNRNNGGSGLGLAITKNIVEAHSGTITAERSDLGGLKISVRLPISNQVNEANR